MDEKKEFENEEYEPYTLIDEEGNEVQFDVIGSAEIKGTYYYAMIPADTPEDEEVVEYVILKSIIDENGEEMLVTIDDDDEFDDVEDYFGDLFAEDIDYDAE